MSTSPGTSLSIAWDLNSSVFYYSPAEFGCDSNTHPAFVFWMSLAEYQIPLAVIVGANCVVLGET